MDALDSGRLSAQINCNEEFKGYTAVVKVLWCDEMVLIREGIQSCHITIMDISCDAPRSRSNPLGVRVGWVEDLGLC